MPTSISAVVVILQQLAATISAIIVVLQQLAATISAIIVILQQLATAICAIIVVLQETAACAAKRRSAGSMLDFASDLAAQCSLYQCKSKLATPEPASYAADCRLTYYFCEQA